MRIPESTKGHVWHQYTIRVKRNREEAVRKLRDAGIGTGIYYPNPAHTIPHVKKAVGQWSLPITERAASQVISLPVHPALTDEDLDRIIAVTNTL